MDKLIAFITQYFDQPNVGDTDANKGQCVGLIELWTDSLSLPHTWGNAKDLLTDADPNFFDIIYNDPNNLNQFPVVGDVFVFGSSYGAGYGHTGVVVFADGKLITLFEQNDGLDNGTPQLKTYNYGGAIGWLHPKGVSTTDIPVTVTTGQPENNNSTQDTSTANSSTTIDIPVTTSQDTISETPSQISVLLGQLIALLKFLWTGKRG